MRRRDGLGALLALPWAAAGAWHSAQGASRAEVAREAESVQAAVPGGARAAGTTGPAPRAAPGPVHDAVQPRLAAAWEGAAGLQVGVLALGADRWQVQAALAVPTRAHGLIVEPEGSLLAVARRPGDWLLRFSATGEALAWCWGDPQRRFNGHARRRGALLYTTESDVETGDGCVVVRDAASLEVRAVWPSHGRDPHDLALAPDGSLWVANGGIRTRPESGRVKHDLERMDSSLVRLDARDGRLTGQWRLDDPRLSLRHLALAGNRLGIALQSEHDGPRARAAAPLLALFDGRTLRPCEGPPLAGYGGDIAATAQGFAIGAPRAGHVARFDRQGRWLGSASLAHACALAVHEGKLFIGGGDAVLSLPGGETTAIARRVRLDNHWTGV